MRILVIVLIFLLVGALFIINQNRIDVKEKEGKITFTKVYAKWLWDSAKNIKEVTAYIIKMDWLPRTEQEKAGNITNQTTNQTNSSGCGCS